MPNNLGQNFYPKLVQIASEVGMKPEDILAIMVSESGINPGSYEKKYHGSGLIGFMPDTLKSLNYQGTWQDFIKLKGEDQLDYVKQLLMNHVRNNGGPLTSAAQYYVANFWPVALRLPGIKRGNPDTIFVEENPQVVVDRKTGKRCSKKYHDVGICIDPRMESMAYKENPLFHGSVQGAITYGDMMRQVDKNRANPLYRKAIADMHSSTGYKASEHPSEYATNRKSQEPSGISGFFAKLEKLLRMFVTASQEENRYLITVGSSSDHVATVEYARILSAALEEYLNAKTNIFYDENNVEIECKATGDKKYLFDAIKELTVGVSDAFKHATKEVGGITAFSLVPADIKSDLEPLHPKKADMLSRKFKLKFARVK